MIYVREVYVNFKSNLDFGGEKFVNFDNNLDFVMLKEPDVKIIREEDGTLNIDKWLLKIQELAKPKTPSGKNPIPFTIDEAIIQNGTFELIDSRKKPFPKETFDYFNFKVENIQGNLVDFFIQRDTIIFKGTQIQGVEKRSKLSIKDIKTDFFYSKTQMLLKNLDARINNSHLRDFIGFYYKKPSDFNDFNNKVRLVANVRSSNFDSQDLGRFSPVMYKYKDLYTLDGDISGYVKDLDVKQATLKFGQKSYFNLNGNFKGFPDLLVTNFDLKFDNSKIDGLDTREYTGNEVYKKYVEQAGILDFSGVFQGTFDDFYSDANVVSSGLGKANGKLNFKINQITHLPEYNGEVKTTELDLAKITGENDLLQKVSFNGKIAGRGFDLENAALRLDGKIDHIWFRNYDYKNINVDGILGNKVFDGSLKISDLNLVGNLNGHIDLRDELNHFAIIGKINNSQLDNLGFINDNVKLQTDFEFDFIGNKLDDFLGSVSFSNTFINQNDQNLVLDYLNFDVEEIDTNRVMSLSSEFFNAVLSGNFKPTELMADLPELVKEYGLYFVGNQQDQEQYYIEKIKRDIGNEYVADYTVKVKDMSNFFAFFNPEISISPNSEINGNVRIQSTSQFTLYANIDTLIYKGNSFFGNEVDFFSSKESFSPEVLTSLVLFSKDQKLANDVQTESLEINGSWGDTRRIDFDGSIRQKNTSNKAQLFGNLLFETDRYVINVNPRNSRLDLLESRWTFNQENAVVFLGNDILFNNFSISNQNQGLSLQGALSQDPLKELNLVITDFDLRTLKPISDLDLEGTANGELKLLDYFNNPILTSNLNIDELVYKKILVGTLAAEALWDNNLKKLGIASNINRKNQEVFRLSGTYDPANKRDALNLTAQLRSTNLEILGTFVDQVFSDLGGYADGILRISGMPLDPIIRGEVVVEQGRLRINSTGGYLYFDDKIIFNEEGFVTKPGGIELRDAAENGNVATMEGGIFNGGSGNFMLGLHAYIKDKDGFKAMDLSSKDNDVFYGTAYAGGDVHITGSFNNVVISGNLISKKNTKITIPLDGATTVDIQQEAIPFKKIIEDSTDLISDKGNRKSVNLSGVRIALNLTLTPDAECEIIFDRTNNDQLNAFGNGRLSITYDTRGGFTMNGPYVVSRGKYDFSFQNLASLRKFQIVDGSRITWSGDPYQAVLNMKASYQTNISVAEVVTNCVSDAKNASDINTRYPVNVLVNITDKLEAPTISYAFEFDKTQIPISYQSCLLAFEQRLKNDEQLLSRNVSSILAFGQIFPETNAVDAFRQQFLIDNLNNLLSNQIGNLANKLDPNLEVNVLLGDFRQNLLNNMQLNFSYKFLNNRVKLSGKSSYSNGDLTNNPAAVINQGQLTVGGEVEYLLSEDGVWKVKGYYRSVPNSNYLLITQGGNVIVSGVNVLFSRNFNNLIHYRKPDEVIPKATKFPIGVGRKEEEIKEVSYNKKPSKD